MTHEEIRDLLSKGCTEEEELKAIHCPVCGGGVTFSVNKKRQSFFIRCKLDSTHMGMTDTNLSAPDWWGKYVSGGWTG